MNGEPASRTGLRLSILGGFSLTYENEPVVVRNRKAQVLLGYQYMGLNDGLIDGGNVIDRG